MSLQIGIVGLPNVGKSSLFNVLTKVSALTRAEKEGAAVGNFPFTTIEPNVAVVKVPDERLDFLERTFQSARVVPATIEFVDIAGLVRGASKGEGLGNQFLGQIRNVAAILEVVRVFDDPNIAHVHGRIDPEEDIGVIGTELLLSDLQQATKIKAHLEERAKRQNKEAIEQLGLINQAIEKLDREQSLRLFPDLADRLAGFQFLTAKPLLYIANLGDQPPVNQLAEIRTIAEQQQTEVIELNVKTEGGIVNLPAGEQVQFRTELGLASGLEEVITASYKLLNLVTFFTAGPKEAHAWTIVKGTKAPEAAGKIHTDFQQGFIRAEIYTVNDLRELGSEKKIREKGRLRREGKDYEIRDGEVIEFLFNV